MADLTKDQIIAQLKDLQADPRTIGYDTFMQGFKLLNPRFEELDRIIQGHGGAFVNSVQEQFQTAFNENPEVMDALIKISEDPAKMDKLIGLLKTNQGTEIVINVLAASNGEGSLDVARDGITTPTVQQFNDVSDIGLTDIANNAGVEVRENPVKTWQDSLHLLGVLAAPVAIAEAPALLGSTALRSTFSAAARWAGGVALRNPLTTFTLGDWAITGGKGTEYIAGKAVDTVGEAVLGENTYNSIKQVFNGSADDGWSLANLILPTALTAVGGFMAYNMLSRNIGTMLTIGIAAVGAVMAYNYLTGPSNSTDTTATADTSPEQRRDVAPAAPAIPAA